MCIQVCTCTEVYTELCTEVYAEVCIELLLRYVLGHMYVKHTLPFLNRCNRPSRSSYVSAWRVSPTPPSMFWNHNATDM